METHQQERMEKTINKVEEMSYLKKSNSPAVNLILKDGKEKKRNFFFTKREIKLNLPSSEGRKKQQSEFLGRLFGAALFFFLSAPLY